MQHKIVCQPQKGIRKKEKEVKTIIMNGKQYTAVPVTGNVTPATPGAEGTMTMVLDGTKCLLVPVQKAPVAKATPAPAAPVVPPTAPVVPPVTPVVQPARKATPIWQWALLAFVIFAMFYGFIWAAKKTVNAPAAPVVPPAAPLVVPAPFAANHILWSAYGVPSFIVTDGNSKESASDVFTDPTKGDLTLTIKPTEETCLLQFGITKIYTNEFSANFAANDTGAGFRVLALSYWKTLPVSDGAYNLCWTR